MSSKTQNSCLDDVLPSHKEETTKVEIEGGSSALANETPPTPMQESSDIDDGADQPQYPRGLRYWAISLLIATMLFLVQIETTIVTNSLVAISNDIGGFDTASWVISSYLLGYVGTQMSFFFLTII